MTLSGKDVFCLCSVSFDFLEEFKAFLLNFFQICLMYIGRCISWGFCGVTFHFWILSSFVHLFSYENRSEYLVRSDQCALLRRKNLGSAIAIEPLYIV